MYRILVIAAWATLYGCAHRDQAYVSREGQQVNACVEAWSYASLSSPKRVRVIVFDPVVEHDLSLTPSLLVAVDATGDTAAYLDIRFDRTIERDAYVHLELDDWSSSVDEPYRKAIGRISKDPDRNRLYCSAKRAYYCHINVSP